jgi:transcriptional regulator with XRE-family HTH domain
MQSVKEIEEANNNMLEYDAFLASLGKALSRIRLDFGFTQSQLASRAHRKQPAIAKIENGPSPNLALRVIFEITQAMPVPLSVVFQMAESQLVNQQHVLKTPQRQDWTLAMAEVKKLPPNRQAWIGQIILNILESTKPSDN